MVKAHCQTFPCIPPATTACMWVQTLCKWSLLLLTLPVGLLISLSLETQLYDVVRAALLLITATFP